MTTTVTELPSLGELVFEHLSPGDRGVACCTPQHLAQALNTTPEELWTAWLDWSTRPGLALTPHDRADVWCTFISAGIELPGIKKRPIRAWDTWGCGTEVMPGRGGR